MSWDRQQGHGGYSGYDGYGNYNDASYSNLQGVDPGGAAQTGDNASYDMFSGDSSQFINPQQSYYDPNAYVQQSDSYVQKRPTSGATNIPNPQPGGSSQPSGTTATMMMGPNELMSNPLVADMAMQYGQNIMGKGQEEIRKNLDKYISIGQLKYYFAVDTNYVGKKLSILLFPFTRNDWSIKYNQEEPVQPKYDPNAPDLYIPCMAYATYILIVGYILGLKNKFSPDLLATTASSSLVWLMLELLVIFLTITIMSIKTSLTKWDILSFSAYKYVGMIVILIVGLFSRSKFAYYSSLGYVSVALAFFLLRTLRLRIEPEVHGMQVHGKRKLYIILLYAGLQPVLMWWLTSYLVPVPVFMEPPTPGTSFPSVA